jgi:hypothetical protein
LNRRNFFGTLVAGFLARHGWLERRKNHVMRRLVDGFAKAHRDMWFQLERDLWLNGRMLPSLRGRSFDGGTVMLQAFTYPEDSKNG